MSTRIGITGHQRLSDKSAWSWVRQVMQDVVVRHSGLVEAVSSLARGADQLFANVVVEAGGSVYAVIPFPGYERTLRGVALDNYRRLLRHAHVETLQALADDESSYLAAGRRVVELSTTMIAVWDGQAARGKGGTADIVALCRSRNVPLYWIDPVARLLKETA